MGETLDVFCGNVVESMDKVTETLKTNDYRLEPGLVFPLFSRKDGEEITIGEDNILDGAVRCYLEITWDLFIDFAKKAIEAARPHVRKAAEDMVQTMQESGKHAVDFDLYKMAVDSMVESQEAHKTETQESATDCNRMS